MRIALVLTLSFVSAHAVAQSAVGQYAWESGRPLEPLSHTATAITGPVRVTANQIRFGAKAAPAKLAGQALRAWDTDSELHTASIYELKSDPGRLLRGNTLCGAQPARFVVFWQAVNRLTGPSVSMAVYSSQTPPFDGRSPGLCGTFSYVWSAG